MRAIGLLLLAFATALAAQPPAAPPPKAQDAALIPRALIFGNASRTTAKVSPDGRLLSWLAPVEGVMNLWVAPASDPAAARPVTRETGQGLGNYNWAPDSRHLLFGKDSGGNENYRIYAVDAISGERRALSPEAANVRADILGISRLRPEAILLAINQRDPQYFDLYEVDYRTGESRRVLENPNFDAIWADNQLRPRLAMRDAGGGRTGFYRPAAGGQWVEAFSMAHEDVAAFRITGFNRDASTAFVIDSRGRDKAALARLDLATGRTTIIGASDEADVEEVLTDPRTFEPVAFSVNHQLTVWHPIGRAFEADLSFLRRRFPGRAEFLFSSDRDDSSQTADGGRMILWVARADRPQEYFLYDRRRRSLTSLFTTRPELLSQPLQTMHPLILRARDGLPMVSYLTLPPGSDADGDGRPSSPVPLVLSVHGGPWSGRDYHGYNSTHQWLANRGYAVLSVNFRGSNGFGKAFITAAVHQFSGTMHDDLIDAVDWAVARGITVRDRVAIMGASYGGYATLVGVSFTPERFRCGVDMVGPSNLVTVIESFPPYWTGLERDWYRIVGNPNVPADRERMLAQSPISRIDAVRAPLLVGQGGNDPRVTKPESDRIVAGLVQRNIPVTYLNFPDEGHGFNRPQNRMAFYAVAEQFLARCLGGRAEPIGGDLRASSAEVLEGAEHVPGLREAARRR